MFRIKICGITRLDDALTAAEAGADAVGLNFYRASPRRIDLETAQTITQRLPAGIQKVGVFVNATDRTIRRACDRLALDWIQLHGDEGPDLLGRLGPRAIIKAFRTSDGQLEPIGRFLDRCDPRTLRAVLIDAHAPDAYGGTGRVVDWDGLASQRQRLAGVPMILAGGLTAENVGQAIRTVRPDSVDTASGVEASPGVKDPDRVRRFVAEARAAFDRLAP